jgi:uncharacterized membrane protein YesL
VAGLFRFVNYEKPGKGVDPDAPEKRPVFLFFELLWRKLFRLLTVNAFYTVCLLPFMIAALQAVNFIFAMAAFELEGTVFPFTLAHLTAPVLGFPPVVIWPLLVSGVILFGPLTCGLTYICRNFARQEHAWNSDFFARAKLNFYKGFWLGVIDLCIISLLFFNIFLVDPESNLMLLIPKYGSIAVGFNYFIMRPYLYLLTITFGLRLRAVFKNAWILSAAGAFRSMVFLVVFAVTFFGFSLFSVTEIVFFPFIASSFWCFTSMFIIWPVVQKYMVDPVESGQVEVEEPPHE